MLGIAIAVPWMDHEQGGKCHPKDQSKYTPNDTPISQTATLNQHQHRAESELKNNDKLRTRILEIMALTVVRELRTLLCLIVLVFPDFFTALALFYLVPGLLRLFVKTKCGETLVKTKIPL